MEERNRKLASELEERLLSHKEATLTHEALRVKISELQSSLNALETALQLNISMRENLSSEREQVGRFLNVSLY